MLPAAAAAVTAMHWRGFGFAGNAASHVRTDGSFTVLNLTPGDYTVQAVKRSSSWDRTEIEHYCAKWRECRD